MGTMVMRQNPREDPLVRSARREAAVVASVSVAATAYSLGYCGLRGYGRAEEPIGFVLGFPAWVFWGIVVPWLACVVVSGWLSWSFMTDDELGEEREAPVDD